MAAQIHEHMHIYTPRASVETNDKTLQSMQKSRWSTGSPRLPAGTCLNGSPRIIERISSLEREVLQSAATTQFGGVAAENSAESLGRGSSRSPRQAQARPWTEAGGAMGNSLLVAFSSHSHGSSHFTSGKRQHIWEMRAQNCSTEEIRWEAASKIQRMVRIALGKKFVKRLQVVLCARTCYARMLSCSHALMLSCSHALMLSCSLALMLSCSHALMLSCSHALMLSCSHALMLSCSHAI
jgi:hypothetical protein